jgi:hypothetical protein
MILRKVWGIALAAGVMCGWVSLSPVAKAAGHNVIYTATGTFASPPVSGQDLFKLAGEPFSLSILANTGMTPSTHGGHWATYKGLTMTGTVQSGLLPTPTTISNKGTDIEIATGNPSYDVFEMFSPVTIVGMQVSITALITLPTGTVVNALIHPFAAPVTISPSNSTVTYSNGTATTILKIASGTLNATLSGGAVQARREIGDAAIETGTAAGNTLFAYRGTLRATSTPSFSWPDMADSVTRGAGPGGLARTGPSAPQILRDSHDRVAFLSTLST